MIESNQMETYRDARADSKMEWFVRLYSYTLNWIAHNTLDLVSVRLYVYILAWTKSFQEIGSSNDAATSLRTVTT